MAKRPKAKYRVGQIVKHRRSGRILTRKDVENLSTITPFEILEKRQEKLLKAQGTIERAVELLEDVVFPNDDIKAFLKEYNRE